jgi:hypothetical protein
MISYLGSFTVGGLFPTMVSFIGGVIPRLNGQLGGAIRVAGQIAVRVPSISARLALIARLSAQIALQPPSVRFNAQANASLIALLQAQLALIADIRAAFGAAGVEAFLYSGSATAMAGEVATAIGGGLPHGGLAGEHIDAFIFATRYPATFSAMGKVFVR